MFKMKNRWARLLSVAISMLLVAAPLAGSATANDQWYKEQAQPMLKEMQALMQDSNYIKMSAAMMEAGTAIAAWQQAMDAQTPTVHLFRAPTLQQAMRVAGDDSVFSAMRGMGDAARKRMEDMAVVLLLNYVTSQGTLGQSMAGMMVAGNAVSVSKLIELPQQFEDTVVAYEYDTFVVLVSFKHADVAVSAQSFVSSPLMLEKLREAQ